MSAFLCSNEHVNQLVAHCAEGWFVNGTWVSLPSVSRTEIGLTLISENIRSLRYRYRHAGAEWLVIDEAALYSDYVFRPVPLLSDRYVIEACDRFIAQSCEHPGWSDSEACAIIAATRARRVYQLLRDPCAFLEWQEAQWQEATGVALCV